MSDQLSIKVTIADRSYPLTIKREEEEGIRKAASMINENVNDLLSKYAVKDKQDLIAMTALQYASKIIEGNVNTLGDDSVTDHLQSIEDRLSEYLKSI
ncbi:MAG: cell division protein ZapA [Flavobacteriales bacterium]|nr:cell division protein ZapA [Flavobacteriales bacterium]